MRPPINSGMDSPPPGLIEVEQRVGGGGAGVAAGGDDGPDEPWNAVCVVGLRVYSTLGGDGVKLKVVRPKNALFDDGTGAPSDVDVDGDGDDGDDETDAAEDNLLTLPNGTHPPVREPALDDSVILDPDDMARGAVAVTPAAPPLPQDGGASANLGLGRRSAGAALRTGVTPAHAGGRREGNALRKGQRRRF